MPRSNSIMVSKYRGKNGLQAPINCRDPNRPAVSYPWNARDNRSIDSHDWKTILTLSKCHRDVFRFLGLDHDNFDHGFEDESQIWNWIISSPYFDIDMFQRSIFQVEQDIYAREKNKLREAYCRFLTWLSANAPSLHQRAELPNPITFFDKEEIVRNMVKNHRLHETRKAKFSGRILVEMGFEHRHIGSALEKLRQDFTDSMLTGKVDYTSMEEWIDINTEDDIKAWVVSTVELWNLISLEELPQRHP